MREDAQRKGRECLYPAIPRNHNEGVIGTHSDTAMFNKYFRDIALNQESSPALGDVFRLTQQRYDTDMFNKISAGVAVSELSELSVPADSADRALVVVYEAIRKSGDVIMMESQWKV